MNRMGSLWAVFSTLLIGDLTPFITVRGPPCIEGVFSWKVNLIDGLVKFLNSTSFLGLHFLVPHHPRHPGPPKLKIYDWIPPKYTNQTPNLTSGGIYLPGCLGVSSRAPPGQIRIVATPQDVFAVEVLDVL